MPRRRSNPLALAVLACLSERPMHPYEMAATMRTRGQDASIRLNYGSLYGVVETLLKRGLVEEQEVVREGRRPERTVYRITDDGRTELEDWMAQLLGRAAKEFPQFEAGLSLMGVLPPERVVGLLQERVAELQARLLGAGCDRRGRDAQRRAARLPRGDGLRARAGGRRLRVHRTTRGLDRVGVVGRRVLLEGRARREAGAMSAIVEVEGIARSFGDTQALCGVDLSVPEGGVVALLGPNGAGKTTLVRILSTLLEPDAGTARVAGFDVVKQPTAVRRCIGLAGQYAAVDETLTGRENLEMVGRLSRLSKSLAAERAAEVLERVSLTDAADRQLKTYSGGMRRRIDLGAGLVARPRVLLLDEPTTGLDPANRLDLWAYLRDLVNEGATILLTTQYLEEADQLASDVVVIDHGTVIATGTPTELKQRLAGDVLDVTVDDADLERVVTLVADVGQRATHRRPRHPTGVAPCRGRGAEPGRGGAPPRRGRHQGRRHHAAPAVARRRVPRPHRAHDRVRHRPTSEQPTRPSPRRSPDDRNHDRRRGHRRTRLQPVARGARR